VVDSQRGWGLRGDTFHCLQAIEQLGEETWFRIGDQDLATHLHRTERLRRGARLSAVTQDLAAARGVRCRLLPMTDQCAPTLLRTPRGTLAFQEYFVKLRQEPEVLQVDLSAARRSEPAHGVLDAIESASGVILAPSNPFISIAPILAVPGIREALRTTPATVAAITPIVAGKALKGPAARMMRSLGLHASATTVADLYSDFLDVFILDEQDGALCRQIESSGVKAVAAQTVMSSPEAAQALARAALRCVADPKIVRANR
jgi:LPPG:FO 2-phospho-L-lactate transferase